MLIAPRAIATAIALLVIEASPALGQVSRLIAPPPPCRVSTSDRVSAPGLTGAMGGSSARVSIAVITLDSEIGDPDRYFLPWALQQRLTEELTRDRRLRVLSPGSVARAELKSAGRRDSLVALLNVQYVLSGRVVADKLGQDVELVLTPAGRTVPEWHARFSTQWTLQAIVRAATGGVERALFHDDEQLPADPPRTMSAASYDAVAAGDFALRSTSLAGADSARLEYERAVRDDPSSAVAAASLARALTLVVERGGRIPGTDNTTLLSRATVLASQAVAADSANSLAWTVRGMIARVRDPVRFMGAIAAHARAVARGPRDALAEHEYGVTLMRLGDERGAEMHLRRALALEPNRAESLAALSELMADAESWSEACAYSNASIDAWPFDPVPYAARAKARLHLLQSRDAYSDAETASRLTGAAWVGALHVMVQASADGAEQARRPALALVARWLAPGTMLAPRDASYLAAALVAVNDMPHAVEAVRRARPIGADLVRGLSDPGLRELRSDTTVARILESVRREQR